MDGLATDKGQMRRYSPTGSDCSAEKKEKPNLRTAYKCNKSECTQTAWLEYAEGVVAASIGRKQRGSDGKREAGVKVQVKAREVQIQKEITQRQRVSNKNPAWGCSRCVHPQRLRADGGGIALRARFLAPKKAAGGKCGQQSPQRSFSGWG